MEFSAFDTRKYPTLPAEEGYGDWAASYEDTVLELMDLRLLARLHTVEWQNAKRVVDLACGTGRIGVWLKSRGVGLLDGVDLTAAMLAKAKAKNVYEHLVQGNIGATGFESGAYDLVTEVLADEHLADLQPLYREAARLTAARGRFVIAGYHSHFLMMGIVTHFNRAPGEPVAIKSYIHLMSDHVRAAHSAGFRLLEMEEGLIDEEWIARKPKWAAYRQHPVSFAMVWTKEA